MQDLARLPQGLLGREKIWGEFAFELGEQALIFQIDGEKVAVYVCHDVDSHVRGFTESALRPHTVPSGEPMLRKSRPIPAVPVKGVADWRFDFSQYSFG